MSDNNIRFEADGRDYQWRGYYGAYMKSLERGVRAGDVRYVSGVLFYAIYVSSPRTLSRRRLVSWVPVEIPKDINKSLLMTRKLLLGV